MGSLLSGRKITGNLIREKLKDSVPKDHFITPALLPGYRPGHRETLWEWMLYSVVMRCQQRKIPDYHHRVSSGVLEYGTTVV